MKFYRRLQPIQALSFDLDDTLYSNKPLMINAEQKMLTYFSDNFPQTAVNGHTACRHYWQQFRAQSLTQYPQLVHDVNALRLYSYNLAIKNLGYGDDQAQIKAQLAFDYFLLQRSDFSLPQNSVNLLTQLAKHYPLVAITNGNVNFEKLGLTTLFKHIYFPGNGIKRKPHSDMFQQACRQLAITPKQLLHIGDCGNSDIVGALQAGCQAAWLNRYDIGKPISVLPHLELSSLDNLLAFI